jgi:hypothetical protein
MKKITIKCTPNNSKLFIYLYKHCSRLSFCSQTQQLEDISTVACTFLLRYSGKFTFSVGNYTQGAKWIRFRSLFSEESVL